MAQRNDKLSISKCIISSVDCILRQRNKYELMKYPIMFKNQENQTYPIRHYVCTYGKSAWRLITTLSEPCLTILIKNGNCLCFLKSDCTCAYLYYITLPSQDTLVVDSGLFQFVSRFAGTHQCSRYIIPSAYIQKVLYFFLFFQSLEQFLAIKLVCSVWLFQ